nr:hypothetical protein CFP56_41717 [Quercus suber]
MSECHYHLQEFSTPSPQRVRSPHCLCLFSASFTCQDDPDTSYPERVPFANSPFEKEEEDSDVDGSIKPKGIDELFKGGPTPNIHGDGGAAPQEGQAQSIGNENRLVKEAKLAGKAVDEEEPVDQP